MLLNTTPFLQTRLHWFLATVSYTLVQARFKFTVVFLRRLVFFFGKLESSSKVFTPPILALSSLRLLLTFLLCTGVLPCSLLSFMSSSYFSLVLVVFCSWLTELCLLIFLVSLGFSPGIHLSFWDGSFRSYFFPSPAHLCFSWPFLSLSFTSFIRCHQGLGRELSQ